jgi:hypothetical protein
MFEGRLRNRLGGGEHLQAGNVRIGAGLALKNYTQLCH